MLDAGCIFYNLPFVMLNEVQALNLTENNEKNVSTPCPKTVHTKCNAADLLYDFMTFFCRHAHILFCIFAQICLSAYNNAI